MEVKKLGGIFEQVSLLNVQDALKEADWVVNCTGFGSRELIGDSSLIPKRGQLVRIAKIAQKEFILDTDHPEGMISIVPRTNDCILGAVSEEGNEDLSISSLVSQKILERCALYYPEVMRSEVLNHVVGLRPARVPLRVESEFLSDGKVLTHNYGHGGNGVTLSWGCALEVAGVKLKANQ